MNRRNNMKYTVFKMTFEKFNVTLQEKQEIKDALISRNLYKTSEKPSFIKICDTLEEAQEELCHWDSYWAHINYGVPFERITQYYIANEDGDVLDVSKWPQYDMKMMLMHFLRRMLGIPMKKR